MAKLGIRRYVATLLARGFLEKTHERPERGANPLIAPPYKERMNKTAKILAGVAALIAAGVAVGAAMAPPQETVIDGGGGWPNILGIPKIDQQGTVTVVDGSGGPCGEGYSLIGDICEPTPEGYVETRSECEMGVDSREAAGVEQDYQAELEKCRNAGPPVP